MYHRARPEHFAFLLEESNARGQGWVREGGTGMRGRRQVRARLEIGARARSSRVHVPLIVDASLTKTRESLF